MKKNALIGRKSEIERLERVYGSNQAEFVVLYGRRRIGKTFLIRQFFESKKGLFFQVTGAQKGTHKMQLKHFMDSLADTFMRGTSLGTVSSWDEAFRALNHWLEENHEREKITLFFDELPWLATARSGLLEILDYYWNHYWSRNPKIILLVCGSSASWLIKNIIYNPGGLHNRCTAEMKLLPFTLTETEAFLLSRKIKLKRTQILDLYMALGGVPYYLSYIQKGLSATENIQKILCDAQAPLKDEFTKLFQSLFKHAETYMELIQLIAKKKEGISRTDLEKKVKLSSGGGRLTAQLEKLEQTNFIVSYSPWGKERGKYYRVIDEFCLFYLSWLEDSKVKERLGDFWTKQTQKPSYHVWAGYAFEAVCQKHIDRVIDALKIQSAEAVSTWRVAGAQIDLLIDRNDDAITLCEIKYTEKPFVMTRAYADILKQKMNRFRASSKTKKQLFMALISANGVKENETFHELIHSWLTVDSLFS